MEKFVIQNETEKISSINRTIRFKPECFEKLVKLGKIHEISFNKVVNQCINYALDNLSNEDIEKLKELEE